VNSDGPEGLVIVVPFDAPNAVLVPTEGAGAAACKKIAPLVTAGVGAGGAGAC